MGTNNCVNNFIYMCVCVSKLYIYIYIPLSLYGQLFNDWI